MAAWARGGSHRAVLRRRLGVARRSDIRRGPLAPPPRVRLRDWAQDWEDWGRRVRRDIILLEQHLLELNRATGRRISISLYDDPGDPPPPPNSF